MKKRIVTACLAASLAVPSMCLAAGAAGSGPNPYSDCGIGAALFQNIKPLAVTSNVIWDLGSTALTSATASPETCSGKTVEAAAFILDNYDNLAEETARGMGEHVTALLNIMEVDEAARAEVVTNIRTQMGSAVVNDLYLSAAKVEKAYTYYSILINSVNETSV